jgi:hypothetical protein
MAQVKVDFAELRSRYPSRDALAWRYGQFVGGQVGPISPPFPNGKGTDRLMATTVFQISASF